MRFATVKLSDIATDLAVVSSLDGKTWQQIDFTCSGYEWTRSLKAIIEKSFEIELGSLPRMDVDHIDAEMQFEIPVRAVEKIICIGKNYSDHAAEMGGGPPEIPVVFSKFSSSLLGPGKPIVLPSISGKVDFEAELVVVIGRAGRNIRRSDALRHVFGYTIGNDITARDLQKRQPGGQWLLGKTFDTFAPIGPVIVTADEITDPQDLVIELTLNGEVMQSSNTRNMIFPVTYLIEHVSQFFTLRPGDLIFTGTPSGVGAGRTPPVFLKPGDHLAVSIQGVGRLENPVIASS